MAEWQYTSTSGFVAEYWRYSIARPSADQVLSHTSLGPGLDGDTKYYLVYYMLYNIILYYCTLYYGSGPVLSRTSLGSGLDRETPHSVLNLCLGFKGKVGKEEQGTLKREG